MKKIIIALALLFVPLIASASIDMNLYYGIHNKPEVQELQEFLIDKGFLTGQATGNFYSLTLKAVKTYQESVGIPKTGYVGTLTRKSINDTLTADLQDSNNEALQETGSVPQTNTINQQSMNTQPDNQASVTGQPQPTNAPTTTAPQGNIPADTAPVPAVSIQIVNPLNGKGLGRDPYIASPVIKDESNYIDIGLVVTNPDGSNNNTATVTVTTSDPSQNKELKGTGTFWGNPHNVYYYPFEYQFKTAGDHVITFTCEGVSVSVTVTAK